jgi:hypothetical protein
MRQRQGPQPAVRDGRASAATSVPAGAATGVHGGWGSDVTVLPAAGRLSTARLSG